MARGDSLRGWFATPLILTCWLTGCSPGFPPREGEIREFYAEHSANLEALAGAMRADGYESVTRDRLGGGLRGQYQLEAPQKPINPSNRQVYIDNLDEADLIFLRFEAPSQVSFYLRSEVLDETDYHYAIVSEPVVAPTHRQCAPSLSGEHCGACVIELSSSWYAEYRWYPADRTRVEELCGGRRASAHAAQGVEPD